MAKIHSSSVIEDGAEIADDVEIGPLCFVGSRVKIGAGTRLVGHVNISGNTTIGENCVFRPMVTIGQPAQDLSFKNFDGRIEIGNGVTFHETCTMQLPTKPENATSVGDGCFFMNNTHIAHDVQIAEEVITASNATFGGFVEIGRKVFVGGMSACHQFVKIGAYAMLGGFCKAVQDIPTYCLADGNPAAAFGMNIVGLKRSTFTPETRKVLKKAYYILYQQKIPVKKARVRIEEEVLNEHQQGSEAYLAVKELLDFIDNSSRGLITASSGHRR